jgi:hypothetical protein
MAVVGPKGAAMIPRSATDPDLLRVRLRKTGLAFALGSIEVDPVDMSLVVEVLSDDPGPMLEAERLSPTPEGDPLPVEPGRYPIVAFGLVPGQRFPAGTILDPAEAVFHAAMPGATPIGLPDQHLLDLLARFATADTLFTCDEKVRDLVARLVGRLAE